MLQSLRSFINDDSRKARNLKWGLSAIVFSILVVISIFLIPWKDTWENLRNSNLKLIILAFLLLLPPQIFLALSYYVLSKTQNASINIWQIFKINLILLFYDFVLPSTFFVSGIRWYRYNQYAKKPAETLTSITYLKTYRILLTILLSVGLLLFFRTTSIQGYYFEIFLLVICIILFLFLAPIICRLILNRLPQSFTFANNHPFVRTIYGYLLKLLSAFSKFRNLGFKTHFYLIVLSLAIQGMQYYSYNLFASSVGIQLTYAQIGAIFATFMLVANIPFNFSIGITLKDVTLISLLVALNVPLDQAAAMSVVIIAKNFLFAIIGGLIEAVDLIKKRQLENASNRLMDQSKNTDHD